MALKGHLSEYQLSGLFEMLYRRRETGRLKVDYPNSHGIFFFKDGELLDARIGTLSGVQAIQVALSLPDSPFEFNSLIQPSSHMIVDPFHRVILDVLMPFGKDDPASGAGQAESAKAESLPATASTPATHGDAIPPVAPLANRREKAAVFAAGALATLSLNFNRTSLYLRQHALASGVVSVLVVAMAVTLVSLAGQSRRGDATVSPVASQNLAPVVSETALPAPATKDASSIDAMTDGLVGFDVTEQREPETQSQEFTAERRMNRERAKAEKNRARAAVAKNELPVPMPSPEPVSSSVKDIAPPVAPKKQETAGSSAQTITLLVEVENGRVSQASVANQRPGMGAYEAAALRIARQRRYSANTSGKQTVQIKVDQPK